jgi:His/Glu/Gln/Arg/opine family amino acid ABC transporter permease subunit
MKTKNKEDLKENRLEKATWKERYSHWPWYRRYEFLLFSFLALIALGFALPRPGLPGTLFHWLFIVFYLLLFLVWAGLILTDVEKPNWIKAIAATLILFLFGWLFYRYSGAQWDKLGYVFFNFKVLSETGSYGSTVTGWTELFRGLLITLQIAIFSAIFGTILGLLLAVFRSLNDPILNAFIIIWVDFFRAIPIIVLMMIIYYALPYLNIKLSSTMSGILALSLNSSAYISEIFRAGIESIHHNQVEAARSLGLTTMQTMRLVILPQAMRTVMPPLTSNYVAMLKDTAICSSIAIMELLKTAITLQAWKANPTPLVAATIIYLIILLPLARISTIMENRMKARGVTRTVRRQPKAA